MPEIENEERVANIVKRLRSGEEQADDYSSAELVDVYNYVIRKFRPLGQVTAFTSKEKAVNLVQHILVELAGWEEQLLEEGVSEADAIAEAKREAEQSLQSVQRTTGARKPAGGRTRRPRYEPAQVVQIAVQTNPHREGTKDHGKFGLLRDGMTVKQALDSGVEKSYISYAAVKGYITVT